MTVEDMMREAEDFCTEEIGRPIQLSYPEAVEVHKTLYFQMWKLRKTTQACWWEIKESISNEIKKLWQRIK